MLSSLFATLSLLFGHYIKHELLGLGVCWAVRTSVQTGALCDLCLLRCSDTSLNTGERPDTFSSRPDGH
jgi:hypothetical protein